MQYIILKINDIVEVVLRVSENQSITDDLSIPDYWGWFCYTQNKFTIIQLNYPFRYLLRYSNTRKQLLVIYY